MSDNIVVVQPNNTTVVTKPVINSIVVTAPGPQGARGSDGVLPIFSRQNQISPSVGNTRFYFETAGTIAKIRASLGTAPTGSGVVVDTLINGVSIGTVTIPANQNTATIAPSQTINSGDYASVTIVSVGSTTSGADLTVTLTVNN
jgi:hypothetical protein